MNIKIYTDDETRLNYLMRIKKRAVRFDNTAQGILDQLNQYPVVIDLIDDDR